MKLTELAGWFLLIGGIIIISYYLPKLLNLIAWSIFAGILIFGGTQISQIGIKLLTSSIK